MASNTASAETTLKVPFNFTVQGKSWPAGLYTVQKDNTANQVMVFSKETLKGFGWVTTPGVTNPTDTRVILKFDESGDTHTLQTIQYGSVITPRLDRGSREKESLPLRASHGR
jgi:hypothetical protein